MWTRLYDLLTGPSWQKENTKPVVWLEDIENGNAEKTWEELGLADVKYNDEENNFKVCAWAKEKGHNMDDNGEAWNPFPANIELEEGTDNHVFVCHGQPATTEGDPSAWDNQFWIQSKHAWKAGTTLKIKFRYKASAPVSSTDTQIHYQTPSNYLIWHAIGNIAFDTEWKTFEGDMVIADDMANGWSIAFNLNSVVKDAVDFYFDDLSWQYKQLDEGYFVSGINTNTTTSYDDLDNAVQFEWDEEAAYYVATFGEKGNAASYVDQIMISTTRGDDQAFKGATLKPQGKIKNDPENWQEYSASTNAKLDLPGLGVWKVYLDTEYKSMAFEMLEGTPYDEPDPIAVVTNATNVVVKGQERNYTADEAAAAGVEIEGEAGQPWDNQFFLIANRVLKAGEVTIIKFKYKASVDGATTGTQCHGEPGGYIHWGAIGSLTFGEDWQEFEQTFTIPAECDGSEGKQMKSIAFNLAEIKAACNYEFKDFQWYLSDSGVEEGMTYENLIDAEGTKNFFVKEGAGTNPYEYGTDPAGIKSVVNNKINSSAVIYNLAGQRVSKDYKGIVVKDNKKVVLK